MNTPLRWLSLLLPISTSLVGTLALTSDAHAFEPLDDCEPVWSTTPSRYHINEDGYSRIPLETIRDLFAEGMEAWSAPCCSEWEAEEAGLTSGVAEDGRNSQNIISFREDSWPSNLGDPNFVLAVTLTRFGFGGGGRCTNLTADMVYNAANNTFATNGSGRNIDFLAVTVHEQGHWLGLDHSTVRGATMQPSYFGEAGRSLHPDDEEGVCYLYNQPCNCTTDAECDEGEQCLDEQCVVPPCTSDSDCAEGLECNFATGDCFVPPCTSDDDCPGTQICQAGECRVEADCSICGVCSSADDCGGSQFICAQIPGRAAGFCTKTCNSGVDCPGNSECFQVPGEDFSVCLNETAASGRICPDDYVCLEEVDLCDGVTCPDGQSCDATTGSCVAGGGGDCNLCSPCSQPGDCGDGLCATFDGASQFCFPTCSSNTDCPLNGTCVTVQAQGGGDERICVNSNNASAGICPDGFICQPREAEPADPCDGVTCGRGETCDPDTGDCVTDDGGTPVTPDECAVCDSCRTDDDCGAGGLCTNLGTGNICTFVCGAEACIGNVDCFEVGDGAGGTIDVCLNADAASAGICPAGFTCELDTVEDGDGGGGGGGGAEGSGTDGNVDSDGEVRSSNSDEGCAASNRGNSSTAFLVLGALAVLVRRRRSQRA
jgi:hypothetical protein